MDGVIIGTEKFEQILNASPERCPITNFPRCNTYLMDERVVYIPFPGYYAFTLPEYDKENKAFLHERYDLDEGVLDDGHYHICDLEDLEDREGYKQIKEFYGIEED